MTTKTDSGLMIGAWLKRSTLLKKKRGVTRGFLFVDEQRRRMKVKHLDPFILDMITRVQNYFPVLIRDSVDGHEACGLSKSFRRGSNLEALNRGVDDVTIDRNNRWSKIERAGVKHYAELLVLLRNFLKYSQPL